MRRPYALLIALGLFASAGAAGAQACPSPTPVQGAPLAGALQVFPADNWWNVDIRSAPVDPGSAGFIGFIGGTRRLHPDFGGEESPGSASIYGFPYAVVDSAQPKLPVTFDYWDESDGVDPDTGEGLPFYPIPAQAITQAHWIEGGARGNLDQRGESDRHLLMVDCADQSLYELYNVYYDTAEGQWYAGSGAYFDLTANDRRPDGWTSADAAGLAVFPGLVRYDEAANAAVPEIEHALRVTVRATNGYVYPASHRAGSTSGALPMGARLRLKPLVNGEDPALRTSDPVARKIFRAMQKYGLIVADNGSDMYISGTFDVRWDNGVLNPAFSTLTASDFEVVQLGWVPSGPVVPALESVRASPNPVVGGQASTGTVELTAPAAAGGALVGLSNASPAFSVPANVTVPAGSETATFPITTTPVTVSNTGTLSAVYAGVTRTTPVTVTPALPSLSVGDAAIAEGNSGTRQAVFTVRLSAPSASAVSYQIRTANGSATAGSDYTASTLLSETIPAGQTSRSFAVAVTGDTTLEADETFLVNLGPATGASIGDGQGVGTIGNDDGPRLSVTDVVVNEGNSGSRVASFRVKLSPAAAGPVSVNLATANGSASAGSDYVARSQSGLVIPAGATSASFDVTVNGDAATEANETFQVNLSNASGAWISDGQGTGTIRNDDGPTLSILDAAPVVEGNAGTRTATFTVRLSQAAAGNVQFTWATGNGSAKAGSDFVGAGPATLAITAGQTQRTFTVAVSGDTAVEANETFKALLTAATGASLYDAQATGTITNDDGPTLSVNDVSVAEGNAGTRIANFTVQLSQAATQPVTYTVKTANGSASASSDYVARTLVGETMAPGQTSRAFAVTINGDTLAEPDQGFLVRLSAAVGATLADGEGAGTIVNDD